MREALLDLWSDEAEPSEHAGLALEVLAPVEDGSVPDADRSGWLNWIARTPVPRGYTSAFDVWSDTLANSSSRAAEVVFASRVLIGHGNPSPIDIGLTLHTTWGVPVIPGTALKGLLQHYIDVVYGPTDDDRSIAPHAPTATPAQRERLAWRGVQWDGSRIKHGPGELHRALFGSPVADDDDEAKAVDAAYGASRGVVTFHDAWLVPTSPRTSAPFLAVDVLTVHQKQYYDHAGRDAPNDFDDPIPVSFLTVAPGQRFLLAVSGPPDWTELALNLLREALIEWGVGGKTSLGYGRIDRREWRETHGPERNAAVLQNRVRRREQELRDAEAQAQAQLLAAAEHAEAERLAAEKRAVEQAEAEAAAARRKRAADTTIVELTALLDAQDPLAREKLRILTEDWVTRLREASPEVREDALSRIRKKFDKRNVKTLCEEFVALVLK